MLHLFVSTRRITRLLAVTYTRAEGSDGQERILRDKATKLEETLRRVLSVYEKEEPAKYEEYNKYDWCAYRVQGRLLKYCALVHRVLKVASQPRAKAMASTATAAC